ncbi:porin [Comamonas terrigena]|uniref:porin n=1 Tax=Comamonas terrigena TaxID=32013 RepID=UPI0024497E13|nr:porin [Comamonas terrigena]MDH1701492.1 porin [Comamonas terrigena]
MKAFTPLCCAAAMAACSFSASAQSSRSLPSGNAGVTVYGVAATEMVHVTNFSDGTHVGSSNRLESSKVTASRLGFIGSEDLGGGLSAVFNLEMGYALDTGAQSNATATFNRSSLVGLRGGFGTVTVGRQWDVEDDILSRYFIFGGYGVFQFSEFAAISDTVINSVKYVSPNYGGVTVRGLYGFGERVTGRIAELAVNYAAGGPLEMGATYRTQKDINGYNTQLSTVGASYKLPSTAWGDWRVHGGYAWSKPQLPGSHRTAAYDVGLVWSPASNTNITLDYVARDQKGTANDSRFVRLGGEYFLSKRTSVIANLIALQNKGTASQRFYGVGAAGEDQSVVSIGLRHAF